MKETKPRVIRLREETLKRLRKYAPPGTDFESRKWGEGKAGWANDAIKRLLNETETKS